MQTRSGEKKNLQTDFGGLKEKLRNQCMQAGCLESPSCVIVFTHRNHNLAVHWKPVKQPSKIEGYKVVISTNDQTWKPLHYTKENYCTIDVYHKGLVKIGVRSYKGEKESEVAYIETELNVETGSQMHAQKFDSKGSKPTYSRNCKVGSNEYSILPKFKWKVKPLLYHKVLHTPLKLTLLPVNDKRTMQVVRTRYHICLKEELVGQIIKSRDKSFGSYKIQVLVRFFMIKDGVIIHEDVLPDFIIRVNGELALAQQKYEVLGGPLDITGLCNFKEGKKCDVFLQIERLPSLKMNYFVMVCVAEKLDIPELVAKWLVDNVRHASKTRKMIQNKLNCDKDVSCTSLKITLTCPLGKGRIVSPCRGQNCEHIQCVDAFTLLKMNEGRPLSGTKCYVCDKPTERIYIDGLFLDILSSVPDTVDKIEFRHDGSWTYVGQDDSPVQSKNCQQNENPWNGSKETLAGSADKVSDETPGPVLGNDSGENVMLDKVKSRLSEIKTQLNQLEVLSKHHEQCNVDSEREHSDATEDGIIIDLCEEDDKNRSSVENISGIQDNEIIDVDQSEDEEEKIARIVNTIKNQIQNDAKKRERIVENEISRIMKHVKESTQEKKAGETVLPPVVSAGNVIDSCEGQVHDKAALVKKIDVERRTKKKKTGENLGNCKSLNNSTISAKLTIEKTCESLENSYKLRDRVRTKSVETTKVMDNDQGDKNKDGVRQFRHSPRILRKRLLQKTGSQSLRLKIQDCDIAENDLNSVNSEMKAYISEQGLFKLDGTSVHLSDLSCLEPDEGEKANEKLQTIQTDSCPESKLTSSVLSKSDLLEVTNGASESDTSLRQSKLKGNNDTEVEKIQVGKVQDHFATTENIKGKHLLSGSTIEEGQTSNTDLKTENNINVLHERPESQTSLYAQSSGSKDTREMEGKTVLVNKEIDQVPDYRIRTNLVCSAVLKAKHAIDLAPPTKNQMKMAAVGMEHKFPRKYSRDKFFHFPSRAFHSKTLENLFTRNIMPSQKGGLQCNQDTDEQEEMESDEIDCKNENQGKKECCDNKLIESLREKIEEGKLTEEPLREKIVEDNLNEEPFREEIEEDKLNKEPFREKIEEDKLIEEPLREKIVENNLNEEPFREKIEEDKLNEEPFREKIEEDKPNEEPLRKKKEEGKLIEELLREKEPFRDKIEECKLNDERLRGNIEEGKLKESQEQVDSLQGENEQLDKSVDGNILESVIQDLACSSTLYKPLKIEDSQINSEKGNAISAELRDSNCGSRNGNPSFEEGRPVIGNVRSKMDNLICKEAQMLCSYCGKLFRTHRVFHSHLNSHTTIKSFVCEVAGCKQGFLSKNLLRRHQLVHTTCIFCKKHFGRKDFLERHLKIHERNWSPWICDLCGKEHSYSFSFKFHKAFHAADQNETLTCGLCDRIFENKELLLSHLEAHAGTRGCIFCKDGDLRCSVCKGNFDTETEFTRNSNILEKKNEFYCHLCKQHFNEIDNLMYHIQTEHRDQMTGTTPARTAVSSMASQPKFTDETALNSQVQPMVLVPLRMILLASPKNIQEQTKQGISGNSHSGNVSVTQAVLLSDQQDSVCQKPFPHKVAASVTDMCKKQNNTCSTTASLNSINPQQRMPEMLNTLTPVQNQTIEKGFVPDSCQEGPASKLQVKPNITEKPLTQRFLDSTSIPQNRPESQPQMHEPPNIKQKSTKIKPLDAGKAAEEQFITIQPLSSLAQSDASSFELNRRPEVFMECPLDSRHKSLRLRKSQEEVTQYSATLKRKRQLKPRESVKRHVRMKSSIPLKRNKKFDTKDCKIYT